MGRRLLRDWLCRPLRSIERIEARQNAVATFIEDRTLAAQLAEILAGVQDVARISGRLAVNRATPRDLVALACSLSRAAHVAASLENAPALSTHRERITSLQERIEPVAAAIRAACVDTPPAHLREGGLIRDGHDAELDEARLLQKDAGSWLSQYQKQLSEKHSLPGLKVGYNRVFGYFIELPAAQARTAPAELVRKQTLKNAERFTTPELREYEGKVTTAEARGLERERELFAHLCSLAAGIVSAVSAYADAVAEVDVLLALAEKAVQRAWVRPLLVAQPVLSIHGGRHPVLDETLGGNFVPNDADLGSPVPAAAVSYSNFRRNSPALALITGPNMAGKSTFIRQTALLALLAHTGSYIPADRATIGIIDRIFTRIGADDALHAGQSTFMVEMIETANILNHATPQSLIILDEVGRGTSTLDGLSLAWAIVEYLAGEAKKRDSETAKQGKAEDNSDSDPRVAVSLTRSALSPRTLFATHYHELTDLEARFPGRIQNLHVAVREWPSGDDHAEIVFLHRILPGRTDQSYGLHVARLAGIPAPVVARGREVLASLAVHHAGSVKPDTSAVPAPSRADEHGQLGLFTEYLPHPVIDALKEVKLDNLSPIQAFDALRRLKELTNRPGD